MVGLTEAQAAGRGSPFAPGLRAFRRRRAVGSTRQANEGFIKLVEDIGRGVLVGATSAGPWGGEVLGALTAAVHGRIDAERLAQMIFACPTFHCGIEAAVQDLRAAGK